MGTVKLILITVILILFGVPAFSQTRMNLDEVIRISLENNPAIRSSRLNIEKEKDINIKSFNIPKPLLFIEYEGVQGSLSNAESRKIGIVQTM